MSTIEVEQFKLAIQLLCDELDEAQRGRVWERLELEYEKHGWRWDDEEEEVA